MPASAGSLAKATAIMAVVEPTENREGYGNARFRVGGWREKAASAIALAMDEARGDGTRYELAIVSGDPAAISVAFGLRDKDLEMLDPTSGRWKLIDGTVDALVLARACWESGYDAAMMAKTPASAIRSSAEKENVNEQR